MFSAKFFKHNRISIYSIIIREKKVAIIYVRYISFQLKKKIFACASVSSYIQNISRIKGMVYVVFIAICRKYRMLVFAMELWRALQHNHYQQCQHTTVALPTQKENKVSIATVVRSTHTKCFEVETHPPLHHKELGVRWIFWIKWNIFGISRRVAMIGKLSTFIHMYLYSNSYEN